MDDVTKIISDLGVPVAGLVACGGLVYFLLSWVQKSLLTTIKENSDQVEAALKKNEAIVIRLIDRVGLLYHSTVELKCGVEESLGRTVDYQLWSEASHKRKEFEKKINERNGS